MPFSRLFVSKSRRVSFELTIIIQDLTNVPLVSGLYYVKWKLKNATHSSGSTIRAPIRDHCIFWGHPLNTMAHLVISKSHELGPCEFRLEVYQELGGSKDTISIGSLTINLSEYAESGLTTRRYLLDDCKFNSTIKLSIKVNQKSDPETQQFNIPPLKKQQIFTDIPSMITDRQDQRVLMFDERSLYSNHNHNYNHNSSNSTSNTNSNDNSFHLNNNNSNDTLLRPQAPALKKSQSAMSLPHYCRQITPFSNTDDPSPADLVEQLFKAKPNHSSNLLHSEVASSSSPNLPP